MTRLLLVLLILTAPAPAQADIADAPQLPPAFVEAQLSAIVRLRRVGATRGGCTAVLIAPRAVLTAGHCAAAPATRQQVVIVPGPTPRQFAVIERLRHPEPARSPALTIADFRTDLAILRLAEAVPADLATPMPLAAADPALPHGTYGFVNAQPSDVVRGHAPCAIQIRDDTPLVSDCHVVNGQSGGALLRLTEDGPRLVGILVAQISGSGPVRSAAAPLEPDHWPALAEVLALPAPLTTERDRTD
ncbi:trypsin-like serine peptidase [Jannaschia sp. CCS1]|uniref:trypsin-like serine peptidase n=1 Tax=Jannaschia sp. (strain CCS1) TaxID=290400 RepID=UPI0002EFE533|nr:trypsin-like serine protease [Jannaschia sp. CCS1]